jgi:hypothetical protein
MKRQDMMAWMEQQILQAREKATAAKIVTRNQVEEDDEYESEYA